MKRSTVLCVVVFVLAQSATSIAQTRTTVNYDKDTSAFPNPERGWFVFAELKPVYETNANQWATAELLQKYHAKGYRLAKHILRIPTHSEAIPQSYLDEPQAEMDLMRKHGFKVFYRFNYNWNHSFGNDGAPLDVTLGHLDQLKPLLHRNMDVLAWMEIGFMGCWGEMHTSRMGGL